MGRPPAFRLPEGEGVLQRRDAGPDPRPRRGREADYHQRHPGVGGQGDRGEGGVGGFPLLEVEAGGERAERVRGLRGLRDHAHLAGGSAGVSEGSGHGGQVRGYTTDPVWVDGCQGGKVGGGAEGVAEGAAA